MPGGRLSVSITAIVTDDDPARLAKRKVMVVPGPARRRESHWTLVRLTECARHSRCHPRGSPQAANSTLITVVVPRRPPRSSSPWSSSPSPTAAPRRPRPTGVPLGRLKNRWQPLDERRRYPRRNHNGRRSGRRGWWRRRGGRSVAHYYLRGRRGGRNHQPCRGGGSRWWRCRGGGRDRLGRRLRRHGLRTPDAGGGATALGRTVISPEP